MPSSSSRQDDLITSMKRAVEREQLLRQLEREESGITDNNINSSNTYDDDDDETYSIFSAPTMSLSSFMEKEVSLLERIRTTVLNC